MPRRRDKHQERHVAATRIQRLLACADEEASAGRLDLATRYAQQMRRIAMRHQVGLGTARHRLCRACGALLRPGVNQRVRLRRGSLVATCLSCLRVRRRPLHGGKA